MSEREHKLPDQFSRIPQPLLIISVLAAVAAYSVLIGLLAANGSTMPVLGLLALPAGFVMVSFASRFFMTLVLALPASALALRFANLPAGNASLLPISMLIGLGLTGLWLHMMFVKRTWDILPTPFNRVLLAFMAVCIFSFPWGILWADPILNWQVMGNFRLTQTASLLSFLVLMWLPFLIGRFIDRPWKIWLYVWTFIVCGILMTGSQFFKITQSVLSDQGLWGLWFSVTLAGLVVVQPGVRWYFRLLGAALLAWHLYLAVFLNSLWISGWLPTLLGLALLLSLHSRKLFILLLVIAIPFAVVGPGRVFLEKVTADNTEEGGLERLEIWRRSLVLVQQHWLFGMGPAGYAPYNMTYFRDDARSTHNNYFDILAQFGVVGLGLWLWFMGSSLLYGWRTIRLARPGLARTVAIIATSGWAAALASMMLGDWVLPFVYNQGIVGFRYAAYSWIFLGLLIVARRMVDEEAGEGAARAAPAHGG